MHNIFAVIGRAFSVLFLILAFLAGPATAQMAGPSGPYGFVSDSDGGKAGKGSLVTLTFIPASGNAVFKAGLSPTIAPN